METQLRRVRPSLQQGRRLHLGVSRLEFFPAPIARTFADPSWIHFGDPHPPRRGWRDYAEIARNYGLRFVARRLKERLLTRVTRETVPDADSLYAHTDFREWIYRGGDRLPFEDNSMDFVFSEHFLNHLTYDDALALMRECHRVLAPGGVVRTCVADADLRGYEPPEMDGYPSEKLPWNHFAKIKQRFTVYKLSALLQAAGFESVPVEFCDLEKRFHPFDARVLANLYPANLRDPDLVLRRHYIVRPRNLIVDGVKHGE